MMGRASGGVVDELAEPADRRAHLLGRAHAGQAGLVAGGVEAGDHRAHRPDAEARLHVVLPAVSMTDDVAALWRAASITRSAATLSRGSTGIGPSPRNASRMPA